MRGASALQNVLDQLGPKPLAVLLVWESVLWTDLGVPGTRTLAKVKDGRAAQYWDPDQLVSDRLRKAGLERGGVIWDVVAIYPPGVRWEGAMPLPAWLDGPVVDVVDEVSERVGPLVAPR